MMVQYNIHQKYGVIAVGVGFAIALGCIMLAVPWEEIVEQTKGTSPDNKGSENVDENDFDSGG